MLRWFILVVLVGRLFIHLIQRFPLPKALDEWKNCNLCSGVWVYTALSLIFGVDLLALTLYELGIGHLPIINESITGAVTSWILYVFEIGYRDKYLNKVILE